MKIANEKKMFQYFSGPKMIEFLQKQLQFRKNKKDKKYVKTSFCAVYNLSSSTN